MDYEMGYWSSWPSLPLQATPLGWGQIVVVQMVESSWLVKKVVRQKEKIPSIFYDAKSGVVMSSTEDELVRQLAQHTDLSSLASFNSSIHPYQFDFIIEHERGIKLFGIPLFSHKSLWPIIDPSHYQSISGKKLSIPISLENYPYRTSIGNGNGTAGTSLCSTTSTRTGGCTQTCFPVRQVEG